MGFGKVYGEDINGSVFRGGSLFFNLRLRSFCEKRISLFIFVVWYVLRY